MEKSAFKTEIACKSDAFILEVKNINSLNVNSYPVYRVGGIPWVIKVLKDTRADGLYNSGKKRHEIEPIHRLSIYLICGKEHIPETWKHPAYLFVGLLRTDNSFGVKKTFEPVVFDHTNNIGSGGYLIDWNSLFIEENRYVKENAINLELEIHTIPENAKKSELTMSITDDNECDDGCDYDTIHVTITNIRELLAVQSRHFYLQNQPWALLFYKHPTKNKFVGRLDSKTSIAFPHKIHMSIRVTIISTRENVEDYESRDMLCSEYIKFSKIISWDDLVNPSNGFVKDDNSVEIMVELKLTVHQPIDTYTSTGESKLICQNCQVCLKDMDLGTEMRTISCGHMFCENCIRKKTIGLYWACPMCSKNCILEVKNINSLDVHSYPVSRDGGIPWIIKVLKDRRAGGIDKTGKKYYIEPAIDRLDVYLFCGKKNMSENWMHPAYLSVGLLRTDNSFIEKTTFEPYVFDYTNNIGSGGHLIDWYSLLIEKNRYVKENAINLAVEIHTIPENAKKSELIMSKTDDNKCDDEGCDNATFHITIRNIRELLAVRSRHFYLQNQPWALLFYKHPTKNKFVGKLDSKTSIPFPHNIHMSITLTIISPKGNVEKSMSRNWFCSEYIKFPNLISWDDLINPLNGFVKKDNSLKIMAELKATVNFKAN